MRAFHHFGAVPHPIAYDNLRAAVKKLVGSERELTPRFQALCAHYVFEANFCRPYTGHDKGGVESRGKAIRWQHLVPIPRGENLTAISDALVTRLDDAMSKPRRSGPTIAERFGTERAMMLPAPARAFRSADLRFVSTSRRSLANVAGAYYSVPCRWAGLELTAYLGVDAVELVGPDDTVVHERQPFGVRSIDYRHFLPELARKPQALRQVAGTLLAQLGEPYGAAWRLLVDAHGPKEAARLFTRVLTAVLEHGEADTGARLARALAEDVPIALALAPAAVPPATVADDAMPEVLAAIEIEAGTAADYDELLGGDQ